MADSIKTKSEPKKHGGIVVNPDGSNIFSETPPTDSSKNNSSFLISYNAAGQVVYVDETIAGISYRTTFTRSDMTVSTTLPISSSVEV